MRFYYITDKVDLTPPTPGWVKGLQVAHEFYLENGFFLRPSSFVEISPSKRSAKSVGHISDNPTICLVTSVEETSCNRRCLTLSFISDAPCNLPSGDTDISDHEDVYTVVSNHLDECFMTLKRTMDVDYVNAIIKMDEIVVAQVDDMMPILEIITKPR